MAGVKGRSGGARVGAGRKAKEPAAGCVRNPLEFLLDVMQGLVDANPNQMKAAIAAAQYTHMKKGEGGKKDDAARKAKQAAAGKFAAATAPLKLVGKR